MNFKRLTALGLAAAIVAGQFVLPKSVARAATATDWDPSQGVRITIPDKDTGVLEGGSVKIQVQKPDNYQPGRDSQNGLTFTTDAVDEAAEIDRTKIEVSALSSAQQGQTLRVQEGFFITGSEGHVVLTLAGQYYALVNSGNLLEKGATDYQKKTVSGTEGFIEVTPAAVTGSFTLSEEIEVYLESTLTLKCKKSETLTNRPEFEIVKNTDDDDSKQTGTFLEFTSAAMAGTVGRKKNEPVRVSLLRSGASPVEISFIPGTQYHYNADKEEIGEGGYYVQEGAIFEFKIPQPISNKEMLNVYSPTYTAKQEIVKDINEQVQVSYEDVSQFIKFAEGEDRNFVRKDFDVNTSVKYHNGLFYLKWIWTPKSGDPLDKNVVLFPETSSGFRKTTVNPKTEDVDGTVTIEIRYNTRDDKVDKDGNTVSTVLASTSFDLKVKGTGKYGSLQQISRQIADPDKPIGERVYVKSYELNEQKMPLSMALNAYDGHLDIPVIPTEPSQYTIQLNMGEGGSAADYAIVTCTTGDSSIVKMQREPVIADAAISDYAFGDKIENPKKSSSSTSEVEGQVHLIFNPQKTGVQSPKTITIQVKYYILNGNKPVEILRQPQAFNLSVVDTSPSDDATLKSLIIKGHRTDGDIFSVITSLVDSQTWYEIGPDKGYTFDPKTLTYSLELENRFDQLRLTPTRNSQYASEDIKVKATMNYAILPGWKEAVQAAGCPYDETTGYATVKSYTAGPIVNLSASEGQIVTIEVVCTAEDKTEQSYKIDVVRKRKGTDSTLKKLTLTDPDGNVLFDDLKPNVFVYNIEVPFKVQMAKVAYEFNDPNVPPFTTSDGLATNPAFIPILEEDGSYYSKKEWLNIKKGCEENTEDASKRSMKFTVNTKAEDGKNPSGYIFRITRAQPSEDNFLSELKFLNAKENDAELTYSPAFHAEMGEGDYYELNLLYAQDRIKVSAKPADVGSTVVLRTPGNMFWKDKEGKDTDEVVLGANTPSSSFTPTCYAEGADGTIEKYFEAYVEVWPESLPYDPKLRGKNTADADAAYLSKVTVYPIRIYRDRPSGENRLLSITLADQADGAIEFLDFDPEKLDYTINVPYEVTGVKVTPKAVDDKINRIEVDSRRVQNGSPSSVIKLKEYPEATIIPIVVYSEDTAIPDGTNDASGGLIKPTPPRTYTLTILRSTPSNDARLVKLEVADSTDFKPVFSPSQTSYSCKVADKAEGIKITATANHPAAKITIDGVRVESGKQSDLIRILEVNQKVTIVVTAQDGITTKTYTLKVRNENLIEKTSNADLEDLEVSPGVMRPVSFKPAVTDYEFTVDEETYSVELYPVTSDALATMKVYQDSREIGDYTGNYAGSLQDGENEFTIEVTSPDESKTKIYTVMVYRNEEDKMGTLNPIDEEEIDIENSGDIIVVDISKYARVSSDVFAELKNYPEKTIIFQGNDYSLQFDAKDLNEVIPHTEVYDFGMSFTSPLEDEIYDEVFSHTGNDDAELVFAYFKYHGDLPGPALLTLSLGRQYKNDTLYWNYYNEERGRVDYEGSVNTNSRGTFSLMLDHMSTYIISDKRLSGSENKSGSSATSAPLNMPAEVKKLNPNTGREDRP